MKLEIFFDQPHITFNYLKILSVCLSNENRKQIFADCRNPQADK